MPNIHIFTYLFETYIFHLLKVSLKALCKHQNSWILICIGLNSIRKCLVSNNVNIIPNDSEPAWHKWWYFGEHMDFIYSLVAQDPCLVQRVGLLRKLNQRGDWIISLDFSLSVDLLIYIYIWYLETKRPSYKQEASFPFLGGFSAVNLEEQFVLCT